MYKPKYSGPENSGVCKCGCSWKRHHLGIVMSKEYQDATGESYLPQECETYGFNEGGGMKFNEDTGYWEDHCHNYVDRGV